MSETDDDEVRTEVCSTFGHNSGSTVNMRIAELNHGRVGKIIKMHLKNFMCHLNLVIEFNSRVNILVGNNGSGKSAVLSALIIGLGKSANIASRSSNIKQLIRRGASSATIEIHLSNVGEDSFEPVKYGRVIIISRHITISGASTYKIKNSNGEVVSKEFSALQNILAYMNIQVENPICVLNQEASRTFLKDTDAKKRFQLFRKGTLIECIVDDLNSCTSMYEGYTMQLKNLIKRSKISRDEVSLLKEKYKSLLSADSLRDNIKELEHELIWIEIIEIEKNANRMRQEIDKNKTELKKLEDIINNRESISQSLKTKLRSIHSDVNAKLTEHQESIRNYDTARKTYLEFNTEFINAKRMYLKVKDKIEHLKRDIAQLETHICEQSDSFQCNVDLRKKNQEILQEKETEKENGMLIIQTARRDLEHINSNYERIHNIIDTLQARRTTSQQQNSRIITQLRQIDVKKSNSLMVYGNQMPKFLAAIENKRDSFSELPRGPIGRYVEVIDSEWQAVVENVIGGLLQSFCVSSTNDLKVLNTICKKFPDLPKFTTIVSKFVHKIHNVQNGMVNQKKNTISLINSIKVSDPIVMNILIDQAKIETILLTEKSQYAQHYTSDVCNVPRNLSKILVLSPYAEYCPAPNYRSYGMKLKPPRFLQTNMVQYKRQLEGEANAIKEQIQEVELELRTKQNELNQVKSQISDKKKKITNFEITINNLIKLINDIKNFEYPAENDVETLNKELSELQLSLHQYEDKIIQVRENYRQKEIEKQDCEEKTKNLKVISTEFEIEIENLKCVLSETKNELQMAITTSSHSETALKNIKAQIKKLLTELQAKTKKINDLLLSAGDRVTTERSSEEVKEEINAVLSKIRTICSINDNIDEVRAKLAEKLLAESEGEALIDVTTKALTALREAKLRRFQWVKRFQQHMSLRIKQKFNAVMRHRHYVGELNINFATSQLDINVIPHNNNIENAVSNTKSLSGGERSFSTLAFLLALWSCVNNPFYCLDEYDVFTDQINQQIMAKLLIDEAEKKSDRQFLFLTPQSMSFIQKSPNITFHRLEDPI